MTEGCFELGLPGGCPDCLAYEKRIDELNAIISDYQADSKNDTDDIVKLNNENKRLREALKTCIDELMYESTTGHLWMWARSNCPVPEKLLEARKLLNL